MEHPPYTLALATRYAVAQWPDDPKHREHVKNLQHRLIVAAADRGLCSHTDYPAAAGRAVISWLVSKRGLSDSDAQNLEVETAIRLLSESPQTPLTLSVGTSTPPAATAQAPSENRSEGKAVEPPAVADDPLCERAQLALQVLFQQKAFSSDSRMTTAAIVAEGHGNDPNAFKEVISDLKEAGYVNTKEGRGGGVWLTKAGKRRAGKL
jgi:hypothetical protein